MFMGVGVGLAFEKLGAGAVVGMGVGLLFMALIRFKSVQLKPVTISVPKELWRIAFLTIGLLVIASGLCLLFRPELLYPYITGFGIIVVGS
jgi:uncharacterized membrane protein